MTAEQPVDGEIDDLAHSLLGAHGSAEEVAQMMIDFARTCEAIGLSQPAARFRAGAQGLRAAGDRA